jgi:hypothetical protein
VNQIDPVQFRDLHFKIGYALWQTQSFERTLIYYITLVLKMPPSRAEQDANAIMEKLASKTLGGLIAELRKGNTSNAVSEFERRVNKFLDERNWLVHKSWEQHKHDLFHPEKLPALHGRLDALAAEAGELNGFFGLLVVQWGKGQGITQEQFEERIKHYNVEHGLD